MRDPIFMTLHEAKKDPGLVNEMRKQINEASIIVGSNREYVAGIILNGHQYYISASHQDWTLLFGTGINIKSRAKEKT